MNCSSTSEDTHDIATRQLWSNAENRCRILFFMRSVCPTGSYSFSLPDDVVDDNDECVFSYWRKDESLLLQISSRVRIDGEQVSAHERLIQALSRGSYSKPLFEVPVELNCPDQAAAFVTDNEGIAWVYLYGVWPDLAIMIAVSCVGSKSMEFDNWTFDAIGSVRRMS